MAKARTDWTATPSILRSDPDYVPEEWAAKGAKRKTPAGVAKPKRRKPEPSVRVRDRTGPSFSDYARSAGNVALGARLGSAADVGLGAGRSIGEYLRGTTPGEIGETSLAIAKAIPGALYEEVSSDPVGFFASMAPGAEAYNAVREGARLRAEGRPDEAFRIERAALPLEAMNFLPLGVVGKGLKTAGELAVRGAKGLRRAAPRAVASAARPVAEEAAPLAAREVMRPPQLSVRELPLEQKMYMTPEGAQMTVMENAQFAPRRHSVTDFVVPDELRGQGLGTALLDEVLTRYDPADLSAAISSPSATSMFYKRGFRPLSEPEAELDRALEMMRENSSITMAVPPSGLTAYHGSPHTFDRFDISKIGTGEGAQAYGHGLYFAEAEPVAAEYRQRLAGVSAAPFDVIGIPPREWNAALMFARQMDPTQPDVAARDFAQWVGREVTPEIVDAFKASRKPGSMYKVNLAVRPEDLLDWDNTFTPEQLEHFAAKFDAVNPPTRRMLEDWAYENTKRGRPMPDGEDVMRQLSGNRVSSKELSHMLNEAGVAGVRYLDEGSRSAGDGTRNYVMFSDEPISILKRYKRGGLTVKRKKPT